MAEPMHDTGDWIPDDTTFGARLALVRQSQGWNIKQAAQACGLDPESWRGWETKKRSPRNLEEVARKIHDATGANYVWLMVGGDATRSRRFAALGLVSEPFGQMELAFSERPELALV